MSSQTPVVVREKSVRPMPTPESLSLRLHARTADELAHVDALLRHFERASGLGWMRRAADHKAFHEIREIACGAVMTYCRGSASFSSVREMFEIEPRPALADRCSVCQQLHVQRRLVEVGLEELCANTEDQRG